MSLVRKHVVTADCELLENNDIAKDAVMAMRCVSVAYTAGGPSTGLIVGMIFVLLLCCCWSSNTLKGCTEIKNPLALLCHTHLISLSGSYRGGNPSQCRACCSQQTCMTV